MTVAKEQAPVQYVMAGAQRPHGFDLRFRYRWESGEPAAGVHPIAKVEDLRAAVAFLASRPGADEIVAVWFRTEFQGGRHVPRIEQIKEIEEGE